MNVRSEISAARCTYTNSVDGYMCQLSDANINTETDLLIIEGEHLVGFADEHVTYVLVFQTNLQFLQSTILDKFVNVKTYLIYNSALRTILDDAFNSCGALDTFYIIQNEITTIPTIVFNNCRNLRITEFDGNRIEAINENMFVGAENIVELNLADNQLSSIYDTTFTNLNALSIGNNLITNIALNAFVPLTELESVHIHPVTVIFSLSMILYGLEPIPN